MGVRNGSWVDCQPASRLAAGGYATGLVCVLALMLAGCGKHYWGKPGAGPDAFAQDSSECARENALYMSGTKEYGIVLEDRYKACLKSRGWVRAQHLEPPPPGWFRGIEGDEAVKFGPPVPGTR